MSPDPIKFRYFTMVNGSNGADIYPCIWTPEHNGAWDGRSNPNTYWLLMEGMWRDFPLFLSQTDLVLDSSNSDTTGHEQRLSRKLIIYV